MKNISILGSTGSIGQSTINVVRNNPERFSIFAIAAHANIDELYKQALEFSPKVIAVYDENRAKELARRLPSQTIYSGPEGLKKVATLDEVSKVLFAMSGSKGLDACLAAILAKKEVLLANKEILINAGSLIMQKAKENKVEIIPIDSEHSALFQCLKGEDIRRVKRLILTASGGPFREFSDEQLELITPQDACKHPNWDMGTKITVDCSTLMNKGLEVIEAHHLFQIPFSQIDVVIHPQSILHSMVEFVDGSIIAQMSEPNMMYPIQYALTHPDRIGTKFPPFDFVKNETLTFHEPNTKKFPCLGLAFQAMEMGGSSTCFLNVANEVLVERFMEEEISWVDIGRKLEKLMSSHTPQNVIDLKQIISVDKEARELARSI